MTEVVEAELIPILPIEQSMSGRNGMYMFCEQRGQSVSYAVCLHTLRRIEANSLPAEIAVECQRGYCHNNCPAKVMKAEEVAAGHALYWKPMRRHITDPTPTEERKSGAVSSGRYDMSSASYARGWAIGGGAGEQRDRPAPKKRTPPPAPKPKSGFIEATGADLVNAVMADERKAKAAPKVEAAPIKPSTQPMRPEPGESMPDFIKRRAAALRA
ncbi:hypothetical protein hairong_051 [Pseudomonas phage hairong]|nr:hypothetical protein hairong_051 [Pseudomonas phage hairong]